jgi:hypothetical protein
LFRALSGPAPASVAHQNTEPDRTISLYRFFGMVQISSGGFLPLSIWTSYFGLGQLSGDWTRPLSVCVPSKAGQHHRAATRLLPLHQSVR